MSVDERAADGTQGSRKVAGEIRLPRQDEWLPTAKI
jgi:hypothetical protein